VHSILDKTLSLLQRSSFILQALQTGLPSASFTRSHDLEGSSSLSKIFKYFSKIGSDEGLQFRAQLLQDVDAIVTRGLEKVYNLTHLIFWVLNSLHTD